ncbi:hypothetical protein E2C01_050682 [Portunus trituberculatus]|uniref:Uncharacterized protein n=1 Tax=Portunus trituberculatus TaxID=210409 RepID=A0A5B7GGN0_PORTR|nr:hypothetical protein [Portunus trituberculatus]
MVLDPRYTHATPTTLILFQNEPPLDGSAAPRHATPRHITPRLACPSTSLRRLVCTW